MFTPSHPVYIDLSLLLITTEEADVWCHLTHDLFNHKTSHGHYWSLLNQRESAPLSLFQRDQNPTDVTFTLYVAVTSPYVSSSISSTSGHNGKEHRLTEIAAKWHVKHALCHCQNSWAHGTGSFILDTSHFSVLIISKKEYPSTVES